jgi:hypothetical protein
MYKNTQHPLLILLKNRHVEGWKKKKIALLQQKFILSVQLPEFYSNDFSLVLQHTNYLIH